MPRRNKHKHEPAIPKLPKDTKEQAFKKSKHFLETNDHWVRCLVCHSSSNINSSCIWEFIASDCIAAKKPSNKNIIALNGQVRVCNKLSHISHAMYAYRGIKYCAHCGYMVRSVMHGLAQPCKGITQRSIHGQRVLDALAADLLPIGVTEWPE